MLGVEPGWANARKMLASPSFLQKIIDFDIYAINSTVFRKLQNYVNHDQFTPERIRNVSRGAAELAQWVQAVNKCFKIIMNIEDRTN